MATTTQVRHGANVLRALARNLDSRAFEPDFRSPLDHVSARDAVTLLAWRQGCTSEVLQFALGLSQPACVRLVDRLVEAGLVGRERRAGHRRLHLSLTPAGERAATEVLSRSGEPVERALRAAVPDRAELDGFVAVLERLVGVVLGDATDPSRFCRSCDVGACLAGGLSCPSEEACRNAGESM